VYHYIGGTGFAAETTMAGTPQEHFGSIFLGHRDAIFLHQFASKKSLSSFCPKSG
jgi:hypothetical protein